MWGGGRCCHGGAGDGVVTALSAGAELGPRARLGLAGRAGARGRVGGCWAWRCCCSCCRAEPARPGAGGGTGVASGLAAKAPTNVYFAQTLMQWEQGASSGFYGLGQWLGWSGLYGAAGNVLVRVSRG